MLYEIGRTMAYILGKAWLHMRVCGKENVPAHGGFILASNHLSNLDPPLLGAACPRRLCYMAKEELFKNPFFARILLAVGAFPVRRNAGDIAALKHSIQLLKTGHALVLFPEGARQSDDKSHSAPHAGIGFLAGKSGVPVVPAFIHGTDKALPKGKKGISPAFVTITFGPAIPFTAKMKYEEFARLVMEKIMRIPQASCPKP